MTFNYVEMSKFDMKYTLNKQCRQPKDNCCSLTVQCHQIG